GGRRAAVMPALQVLAFPKDFAVARVQTGRTESAEVHINSARFDRRRRRRVTIHGGAIAERLRVITVKHFFVEADLAGLGIGANSKEIMAILGRRRHPNLAAHYDWRGPAATGNLCFP